MKWSTICIPLFTLITICCCNEFFGTKRIEELDPIIIQSKLGSKIVLSILNSGPENHTELTNPTGDIAKQENINNADKNNRNTKINKGVDKNCLIETNFTTCTVNFNNDCKAIAHDNNQGNICNNQNCDFNEIIYQIGPLEAKDFGNWVISKEFYNGEDVVEMFRVISVEIKEEKSAKPKYTSLNIGNTYKLRFQDSIPELQTCEIISPDSTFDRYYERDLNNLEFCGYVIKNVTVEDAGLWKIVAVGQIVYEGYGMLEIVNTFL